MKRVGILSTHPIQYHAQWFRALAARPELSLDVLYCHNPTPREQADAGFGVPFAWDIPLLEGYRHRFLENVSQSPSVVTFGGLDTPEIGKVIRQRAYDVVITNGWHYKSAWQAIYACWQCDVPIMVRSDSHLRTRRPPLKRLLKAIPYRWFISRLDGCLAVGRWSADYFLKYGAREDRVHIVPHVVDSAFGAQAASLAPERWRIRAERGFDDEGVVFLFAGKFTETKRPMDFVRAIQAAHGCDPRIRGFMVGDGALRASCENLARDQKIPIQFAGFLNQSQIVSAYVAADALVLPSEGETWGIVVNEAMACGKPALVSDEVGCGPDLVKDGRTGFVFPVGDIHRLAGRMIDCAEHPERTVMMGTAASQQMGSYTVPVAVDRVVKAVEGCLSE